jgi:hypothetical protein
MNPKPSFNGSIIAQKKEKSIIYKKNFNICVNFTYFLSSFVTNARFERLYFCNKSKTFTTL